MAIFLITAAMLILLLGKSLWIPASRIENLYARSVVLALADALASVADSTGVDVAVPAVRAGFLRVTGLSGNPSWDSTYYNRRDASSSPLAGGTLPLAYAAPDAASAPIYRPERGVTPLDTSYAPRSGTTSAPEVSDSRVDEYTSAIASGRNVAQGGTGAESMIHSRSNPIAVYMFGDSQVYSLGSGLVRLAGDDTGIAIDYLAIHSSGFIRGDYYNWPLKLADVLSAKKYDAVVMMLGMNDYQSVRGPGGEILKKHTAPWEAAYREKCRELIDLALMYAPRVYWIGMPVVKSKAYAESLAYIDSVQASLADEYGPDVLVRVPIADAIPGKGKPYSDSYDAGGGKIVEAMSSDGSHFTVEGGQIAMLPLFDRLARDYPFAEVPVAHTGE
jgi:uncharacterized protein